MIYTWNRPKTQYVIGAIWTAFYLSFMAFLLRRQYVLLPALLGASIWETVVYGVLLFLFLLGSILFALDTASAIDVAESWIGLLVNGLLASVIWWWGPNGFPTHSRVWIVVSLLFPLSLLSYTGSFCLMLNSIRMLFGRSRGSDAFPLEPGQ